MIGESVDSGDQIGEGDRELYGMRFPETVFAGGLPAHGHVIATSWHRQHSGPGDWRSPGPGVEERSD
ncbi:hypothetical protein HEK131_04250 [Streptomyces seoulensis]|nr:hypothetical protein HEK131_04250 [Streptomyces seoulensis]